MDGVRDVIANNPSVNAMIHACFALIGDRQVALRFQRDFDSHRHDNRQVMNTYRELVVGGYLANAGFRVRYAQPLGGKTPDWHISAPAGEAILEVFTHHPDEPTSQRLERGEASGFDEELNLNRVHTAITEKVGKYRTVVGEMGLVIAVCIEFASCITPDGVRAMATGKDGTFAAAPELSGILIADTVGGWRFVYVPNASTSRNLSIPSAAAWSPLG